jgi:hypothetical protein
MNRAFGILELSPFHKACEVYSFWGLKNNLYICCTKKDDLKGMYKGILSVCEALVISSALTACQSNDTQKVENDPPIDDSILVAYLYNGKGIFIDDDYALYEYETSPTGLLSLKRI